MSVMGLDWFCKNMDVSILLVEVYWRVSIDIPNVKAGFPA
jgi:hypothetical protein